MSAFLLGGLHLPTQAVRREQWEAEGARDLAQRANGSWKKQLAEYQAPAIDPGVDEALQDHMKRRKAAFADSNV